MNEPLDHMIARMEGVRRGTWPGRDWFYAYTGESSTAEGIMVATYTPNGGVRPVAYFRANEGGKAQALVEELRGCNAA